MRHPQGGFYSALDADSVVPEDKTKKAEGAYYLWMEPELKRLLTKKEFELVKLYFDLRPHGKHPF